MGGSSSTIKIGKQVLEVTQSKDSTSPILLPGPIEPQAQCPLLSLPGELRNMIYQHTSEVAGDVYCVKGCHGPSIDDSHPHIQRMLGSNQLKYVCRQLYHETSAIGLHKKDVSFKVGHVLTAATWLDTNITKLIVEGYKGTDIHVAPLVRACRSNPKLEVFVLSPSLVITAGCSHLIPLGAAMQMVLRNRALPFSTDHETSVKIEKLVKEILEDPMHLAYSVPSAVERPVPSNFKIFPWDAYDEETLRYSYLLKRKGFEDWIAQIREWYSHGI
ncbi:hypothetical protein BU26DRAFT_579477 [Trematosphaeria pertusa]|uniref:Uncharacterized protein n=1 Tax=Trematosphaeria pertusa TaxID=390896 RepID=A0A6A6I2U4_9PLEO|nr:uncharacterized protein BU26DRAFT_579477 [Trematosphaeria pertusa]KAF2244795.1 hypothetical protein BU26DRAFT_579477 [Trematosphaeria pertusa]